MSQFQFDPNIVPQKFVDQQGTVNVQALMASADQIGLKSSEYINQQGQIDVNRLSVAYREKEAAQSQPPAPPVAPVPAINTVEPTNPADVDWSMVRIDDSGVIPPAQRQALLTAKVPSSVIDSFEAGQKAIIDNNMLRLYGKLPGGKETFTAMVNWANASLEVSERQRMDAALRGPAGEMALMGYYQQFVAENPVVPQVTGEPNLGAVNTIGGGIGAGGPTGGDRPFMNDKERRRAFNDVRYGEDIEYTEAVFARARATTAFIVAKQATNPTKGWSKPTGFNK